MTDNNLGTENEKLDNDITETSEDVMNIEESVEIPEETDAGDKNSQEEPEKSEKKKEKQGLVADLFDYVEIFAFSVLAVLVLFSFVCRICQVDGSSMNQTLRDGERLLTANAFYTPSNGDIIVFHQTGTLNEPLVKRVIAIGGQTVKIDFLNAKVYVDGELFEDYQSGLGDYVYLNNPYSMNHQTYVNGQFYNEGDKYIDSDGCYVREIPEGYVFVMGDNRDNSKDSRYPDIGLVDQRRILGKVLFRLKPFTKLY